MNTNIVKTKRITLILVLALASMILLPFNAIVANAAPEDNITVEYRYVEGETVEVPPTITQLNREYRLLTREEPVLESTLPLVRTYNYRIDGALTPAELALLQSGNANLTVSPVDIIMEREVDKTKVIHGNPNNDADSIPLTDAFEVSSATDPSGTEMIMLNRAGIEFEVETWEIPNKLPDTYKATVVYRGIETYNDIGYYLAETTYQTQVTEGEENVYIIVATYEPTDLDDAAPVAVTQPPEPQPAPPEPEVESAEFTPEQLALLDAQTPLSSGPLAPIKNIVDGLTPLGGVGIVNAWSVLSMLMSLVALVLAVIIAVGLFTGRNSNSASVLAGNEEAVAKNKGLIKILALIFSVLTVVTWLFVDNLTLPQVWINKGTIFVGIIFIATIVFFFISSKKSSKAKQKAEAEPDEPAVSA